MFMEIMNKLFQRSMLIKNQFIANCYSIASNKNMFMNKLNEKNPLFTWKESFVHMRIIDTSTSYGSYKYANFHHAWLTFNEVWWMLYDLVKSAFCDFDFFFFVLLILKTFFLWRLVNEWNWYFIHISCWFFATLILTFLSSWLFERKII